MSLVKVAINDKKVSALDICLVSTFLMLIGSYAFGKCMGASLTIEKQHRWPLLVRGLVGILGFTMATFSIAMVPLLVFNTSLNTAPFWASLLSCVFLGETMTRFEVVALVLSFGGVFCIAYSSASQSEPVDVD